MTNRNGTPARKPRARFYINDKAKGQDMGLANFRPGFNERYSIIDRETGKEVDEAVTQYEARQAVAMHRALAEAEGRESN